MEPHCDEKLDDAPCTPPNSPDISDELDETSLLDYGYHVNGIKGSIDSDAGVYYELDKWIRIENEELRVEFSTFFEDFEFNSDNQRDESTGIITTHENIKTEARVIANCSIRDTSQLIIFTITPKETNRVFENFEVLIELKKIV